MWATATAGPQPFRMSDAGLALELSPALPGWLFASDGTLSFTFLGKTQVVYHNPESLDVYPEGAARIVRMTLESTSKERVEIAGSRIGEPWASRVRGHQVSRIDAFIAKETAKT
jgi:hypothetical protein